MSTLNVTTVQADLRWHDAARNLDAFSAVIDNIDAPTDLIVLPEMFTTGFTMDARSQAERMDGRSAKWLEETAARTNAAVCGSLIIEEDGLFYNRFLLVKPDGSTTSYDKRHLLRLAGENVSYQRGTRSVTVEINGFRICPMICYDLRFPVWSRNRGHYDLLLYVANWPSPRHFAWETLIRARAIENLSYVAAVNRTGTDGNDLKYSGGTAVIDFLGQDLASLGGETGAATATLDLSALNDFRDRYPFHLEADEFSISA
jgi:omega-amidase